jgi:hypothetical protein
MKKQLLTTTSLVAAGVLAISGAAIAGKPKLTVGGNTHQIIGVGENDSAFDAATNAGVGRVGLDQHSDTEIHFNGSVTLDNGIRITTRTELEGNSAGGSGAGDNIDENWMRISGGFGQIVLGSHDMAGQAMTGGFYGSYSTNVGLSSAFDTTDWINSPAATVHFAGIIQRVDNSSDSEGITYYTPRMSGFQAGISYMPARNEDLNSTRELKNVDTDGISLGLNFVKNMGGVGVGVAVGYATSNESTVNLDDTEIYGIGVRLDFQGFRIAMSHNETEDQGTVLNTASQGVKSFEAGVRYTFGANAASATYTHAESNSRAVARDNDESETMMLSYRRTLGPGVTWSVNAIFADFEDGLATPAAGSENDGQAFVTGLRVGF